MASPSLTPPRLSDTIATRLEQRILEGTWKPGNRLPSERDLAAELGVSRPSLREALQKLVSKGLITVRHGGGSFVTDRLESALVNPWQEMVADHPGLRNDLLEFRHILESQAAALAARRATGADITRMDAVFQDLENAYGEGKLERVADADVHFHQVVAESSHNAIIGHLTASLLKLIHDDVQDSLSHLREQASHWHKLMQQHRRIWQAVRNHQPDEALEAARSHIEFVQKSLAETEVRAERRQSALRRLEETPEIGKRR